MEICVLVQWHKTSFILAVTYNCIHYSFSLSGYFQIHCDYSVFLERIFAVIKIVISSFSLCGSSKQTPAQ